MVNHLNPFEAMLTFTYRCNLACPFCYERDHRSALAKELPLDTWWKLIDEMAELKMFRVKLNGGEPFAHPYFRPMLERLSANKIRYFIISNGTMITPEWVDFIANTKRCDGIQLSLDGLEAYHDSVRGVGMFRKTVRAIHDLANAGIPVKVNSVICVENLRDVVPLGEFLETLPVLHYRFNPRNDMPCDEMHRTSGRLTLEDFADLCINLERHQERLPHLNPHTYSIALLKQLRDPEADDVECTGGCSGNDTVKVMTLSIADQTISFGAQGEEAVQSLRLLASLMGLSLSDAERSQCDALLICQEEEESGILGERRELKNMEHMPVFLHRNGTVSVLHDRIDFPWCSGEWGFLLRLGVLKKLRENGSTFFLHGALLENSDDTGTLLFGHSGVGKTTTVARFRAAGGTCRADDMILCNWNDQQLMAHPLPTSSYYRGNWRDDLRYLYQPEIRVRKIGFLQRGSVERMTTTDSGEWLAALTHAISFHFLGMFRLLTPEETRECSNRVLDLALDIEKHFPPLALEANLAGDIMKTLYGENQ